MTRFKRHGQNIENTIVEPSILRCISLGISSYCTAEDDRIDDTNILQINF